MLFHRNENRYLQNDTQQNQLTLTGLGDILHQQKVERVQIKFVKFHFLMLVHFRLKPSFSQSISLHNHLSQARLLAFDHTVFGSHWR